MTILSENIKKVDYEDNFIYDSYSVWKDITKSNPNIKNKLVVSEKELAEILGMGYSESKLEKMRKVGTHFIEYIQIIKKGRVLYPIMNICEYLSDIDVENKTEWIKWQIKQTDIISNRTQTINDNQLSKLLDVKPSTISNYNKYGFFIKKIKKNYLINEISIWIVKSTIKCNN